MNAYRKIDVLACAVVAAMSLGTAAVHATEATMQDSAMPAPITLAQAGRVGSITVEASSALTAAAPPMQAGVRKAAAEGKTALRRYVNRTQPIYNYHYWDFAKYLPPE